LRQRFGLREVCAGGLAGDLASAGVWTFWIQEGTLGLGETERGEERLETVIRRWLVGRCERISMC
jgi:hypothetical protein